ncbi:MAG: cell division protein FtsQ/DivIB [Chloroflexi bacterium]|nr:cell division protein FtsQ/DivIB [Chloroflexota bacterium]
MSVGGSRAMAAAADRRANAAPPRDSTTSLRAWVVTKLLALLLLFGASGLLYHVAASDDYRIALVSVTGAALLPTAEIESTAGVTGINIFWVRQEEVGRRLQTIAAVQSARVRTVLPNRLEVRIAERVPVAVWQSGGASFYVDDAGRVLRAADGSVSLPIMNDVGSATLQPGDVVDVDAVKTMFQLQQILPGNAGLSPQNFEYSADSGVTVVGENGVRLRFGRSDDLEWKVRALVAIRQQLEREGQRVELIDLRFKDRPYAR